VKDNRTPGTQERGWHRVDWDLVEKLAILGLYAVFLNRLLGPGLNSSNWLNLAIVASESLVVIFVLLRRKTSDISRRPYDWFIGVTGTGLPLLIQPVPEASFLPAQLVATLMVAGFIVQFSAKLTLRRSFGVVAANRGVKVSGAYRYVRHPMYAGYMLTQLGFLLARPAAWNLGIYFLAWTVQIARIRAEERMLEKDVQYRTLKMSTKYRLLPGIY
jgi:protein-S-isoprenylcysteine O-methyltransferase Ste14